LADVHETALLAAKLKMPVRSPAQQLVRVDLLQFLIEDTHLTDLDRINKLFSLALIAFVWAYKPGIFFTVF